MRTTTPSRSVLAALALLAVAALPAPAAAQPVGLACTTGASPNPTFTITVREGYIQLADGNTMYMWGYSPGDGPFQHPGPVLCVTAGDAVTVVLRNPTGRDVSMVFPGQEDVRADGAPVQPQVAGGFVTSFAQVAPAAGGTVTYTFVASRPGTFPYQSGTDPFTQVRMGLFGALVVRPAGAPLQAYDRPDSAFTAGEEFLVLLSEIDPYQHYAAESGVPFDPATYHPRYWLLNGRGFPDTVADNFVPWLPAQPYGALARVHPSGPAHPLPGLIRYLNFGTENYPFHPHGNNGLVIGRDGHPLAGPGGEDLSFEKFAINIAPGQTWDVLFGWRDAEAYDAAANPVTVTVPSNANLQYGMFYSGSPYLGSTGPLPPGASTLNQCGEFYIISHNHALHQLTAWGTTMAGPITYLRVDPPAPNSCP